MRVFSQSLFNILAVFSLTVLALSFVFLPGRLPVIELCWFHRLTELPCPGCGLTRSFCAISHGDLAGAWQFNPFSFIFYPVVVITAFLPVIEYFYPQTGDRIIKSRSLLVSIPLLVLAMWVFGVWRITC